MRIWDFFTFSFFPYRFPIYNLIKIALDYQSHPPKPAFRHLKQVEHTQVVNLLPMHWANSGSKELFLIHPLPYYNQFAICNSQMWLHQYCLSVDYTLRILISSYLSFPVIVLKASHPVPTTIFIICYKFLTDFLSLVFSLIRGHNQG